MCQNKRESFLLQFIIELDEGIYSANYTLPQVVYMNTGEMIVNKLIYETFCQIISSFLSSLPGDGLTLVFCIKSFIVSRAFRCSS